MYDTNKKNSLGTAVSSSRFTQSRQPRQAGIGWAMRVQVSPHSIKFIQNVLPLCATKICTYQNVYIMNGYDKTVIYINLLWRGKTAIILIVPYMNWDTNLKARQPFYLIPIHNSDNREIVAIRCRHSVQIHYSCCERRRAAELHTTTRRDAHHGWMNGKFLGGN